MESTDKVDVNIANLSSHNLSAVEISILNKGLKFCPTPKKFHDENVQGMDGFCRKLRLTELFHQKPQYNENLVEPRSYWTPDINRNEDLDIAIDYLKSVSKVNDSHIKRSKSNISEINKEGLKKLTNNNNIVIKEVDKGSCTVIMNVAFYKKKMIEILSDTSTYKEIQENIDRKILITSIEKFT